MLWDKFVFINQTDYTCIRIFISIGYAIQRIVCSVCMALSAYVHRKAFNSFQDIKLKLRRLVKVLVGQVGGLGGAGGRGKILRHPAGLAIKG